MRQSIVTAELNRLPHRLPNARPSISQNVLVALQIGNKMPSLYADHWSRIQPADDCRNIQVVYLTKLPRS